MLERRSGMLVRKGIAVGIGLAVAAMALSGCVTFKGPIRGKQVSEHRVQVRFAICAEDEAKGGCYVPPDTRGDKEARVLLAFRVPKGTGVPKVFQSRAGSEFVRLAVYTQELNARAVRRPSQKWVGFVSAQTVSEAGPLQARFRVRFRLPDHPGDVFKYRPAVGGYNAPPFPEHGCAPDLYDYSDENHTICIDDPQSVEQTRRSLRIPLD
jgi:hypothetical protein